MFTLLALGAIGFVIVAALALLGSLAALVLWVFVLPFKLLAFVFRGLAGLLALPFLLVFGIIGAVLFAAGMFAFFVPALPFVLLGMGIWWLMRRRHPVRA